MKKTLILLAFSLCLSASASVTVVDDVGSKSPIKETFVPKMTSVDVDYTVFVAPSAIEFISTPVLGFNTYVVVNYAIVKNEKTSKLYLLNRDIRQCRRDSNKRVIHFKKVHYTWLKGDTVPKK